MTHQDKKTGIKTHKWLIVLDVTMILLGYATTIAISAVVAAVVVGVIMCVN